MRGWYEKEAAEQTWSLRTLQRNISLQYYYRLLKSQIKKPVNEEVKELTAPHECLALQITKKAYRIRLVDNRK